MLRHPHVRLETLVAARDVTLELSEESRALDVASLETTIKYAGYLKQEESRARRAAREERRPIPYDFPFAQVPGLSREAMQRLSQIRPATLGQASRIPGMTPAAVAVLGAFLGRLPATPAATS